MNPTRSAGSPSRKPTPGILAAVGSWILLLFLTALPLFADTKTVTFAVKGWTCGSCAASTRIALKKLDGVEDVKTDTEKMVATITYDDAKVTSDKMVQAIERLGYKATVRPASSSESATPSEKRADLPPPVENISLFEVPLECGAAAGLGCGSASKPVLKALDRHPNVKDARINYPGTVLAVAWTDPAKSPSGIGVVEAALKERDLDATLLRGAAREKALKDYESGHWYGAADVDRLSEHEAEVIAARLVSRAKAHLGLSPEKLAALTKDLTGGIGTILTRDKEEECARDPFEELSKIARKHLNEEQMVELKKAADQGAGALPGEAK